MVSPSLTLRTEAQRVQMPAKTAHRGNHAHPEAPTAMAIKVFTLDLDQSCKSGYFPSPGKPAASHRSEPISRLASIRQAGR